ncbi:hypothetical protein SAMN05216198_1039 [Halopseudomonas litoralis]|uniref:Uncharacterized protein n=2 Tax=Halopseudomonas litoralis TaxID=797277 RepID=A0A1H1NXY1_9GAMM|nr:hypothetical protein SAMN05216198_1039 [Halopseudomonas litoralis]
MKRLAFLFGVLMAPMLLQAAELSAEDERALRSALDEHLRDADSAKFKDLKYGAEGSFCVKVNAKNAYGAYAGYSPFMGMKLQSGKFFILKGGSSAVEQVCRQQGMLD